MVPTASSHLVMKAAMTCGLLAFCLSSWAQTPPSMSEAREAYRNACSSPEEKAVVLSFISTAEKLKAETDNPWTLQGMEATAQMMLAESMMNPFEKLQQFNTWKGPLEDAIDQAPNNPDLRLFRLSIQWTVPPLLGYSDDMETDMALIEESIASGQWSEDSAHLAFVSAFIQHIRDDHSH
ncbi:MAG TPA: hypothetical protein DDZ19_02125 [Flavobacteriales bacterium]|jgi:hypothetical protein|nr:hypothetical protein [Flavobacteriales bacterium]